MVAKLNTMVKQKSNTAFNNILFTKHKMMDMHESMERLYSAAKEIKKIEGQSAVARLLNELPQTLKNWESRGISKGGAIKAQEVIGCNANWLTEGKDHKTGFNPSNPSYSAQEKLHPTQSGQAQAATNSVATGKDAFITIGELLKKTDPVTKAQITPLLEQLSKTPELAAELGDRLEATIAMGSAALHWRT